MPKKLSFLLTLRWRTHPHAVRSLKSPLDFYPNRNVHSFTIIARAIRFRAFLDRKTNTFLSSHKTILELSLMKIIDLYLKQTAIIFVKKN